MPRVTPVAGPPLQMDTQRRIARLSKGSGHAACGARGKGDLQSQPGGSEDGKDE